MSKAISRQRKSSHLLEYILKIYAIAKCFKVKSNCLLNDHACKTVDSVGAW